MEKEAKTKIGKEVTVLPNGRRKVKIYFGEETRVQRQFKKQSDINEIMKKYQKGEAVTHLNRRQGVYTDLTQIKDYQTSLSNVIEAQNAFMTLPSGVRKKFENDPQGLIQFLSDKNNMPEAIELGLIPKPITNAEKTTINDDKSAKEMVSGEKK